MVIIEDRHRNVVDGVGKQSGMPSSEIPTEDVAVGRRQWVAPTWDRRDTPMEVTMYAGQR